MDYEVKEIGKDLKVEATDTPSTSCGLEHKPEKEMDNVESAVGISISVN